MQPRCLNYSSHFFWLTGKRRLLCVTLTLMLGILPLTMTGCSSGGSLSAPYFPVQKNAGGPQMLALSTGKLVLDNGYLRLKSFLGINNHMLIWPYGYSVQMEEKRIRIIDDKGKTAAIVGGKIKVGGGEVKAVEIVEKYIGEPLPPDCAGPWWIVSRVIED